MNQEELASLWIVTDLAQKWVNHNEQWNDKNQNAIDLLNKLRAKEINSR